MCLTHESDPVHDHLDRPDDEVKPNDHRLQHGLVEQRLAVSAAFRAPPRWGTDCRRPDRPRAFALEESAAGNDLLADRKM